MYRQVAGPRFELCSAVVCLTEPRGQAQGSLATLHETVAAVIMKLSG